MRKVKFIIAIIAFLSVYILLSAYFSLTKPRNVETEQNLQTTTLPTKSVDSIQVTLKVLDEVYSISTEKELSLYQAMQNLTIDSKKSFLFSGKEYPSMGFFVEEINGIKEDNGKFWIYYVNNKKASVGVSNYILKSGDVIEWKQEANF